MSPPGGQRSLLPTRNARIAAGTVPVLTAAIAAAIVIGLLANTESAQPPASPAQTPPAAPAATSTLAPITAPGPPVASCFPKVDQAGCIFAAAAEGWVRDRDITSLVARGSSWDNPNDRARLLETIESFAANGSDLPLRLVSIACPTAVPGLPAGPACMRAIGLPPADGYFPRVPPGSGTLEQMHGVHDLPALCAVAAIIAAHAAPPGGRGSQALLPAAALACQTRRRRRGLPPRPLRWLRTERESGDEHPSDNQTSRAPIHLPVRRRRRTTHRRSNMRTIGVLGGLGPQATMDFEVRFHRVAQRRIPQFQNSGYPPLVVYYHRRPPFVMGPGNAPASPLHAEPDLLTAAQWLGARADLLVIPANAPHAVQDQIERAAGRKVLSMIDVTLDDVRRRGWKSVGVMGFGDPKVPVYTDRLREQNVAYHIIDEELQPELDKAIFSVMEGRTTPESTTVAQRALAMLRDQAVDGIILGCTELPLLLADDAGSDALANPVQLLAEAAVEQALA